MWCFSGLAFVFLRADSSALATTVQSQQPFTEQTEEGEAQLFDAVETDQLGAV